METRTPFIKSNSFKIFLLYLTVTYLPGCILFAFFSKHFFFLYNGFDKGFLPLLLIPVVVLLVVIFHYLVPKTDVFTRFRVVSPFRMTLVNLSLSAIYAVLSAKYYLDYGLQFRHSGMGLSDVSFYVTLMFFLKQYVRAYTLYELLSLLNNSEHRFNRLALTFGIFGSFFSLGAASDIPMILIPACFVLLPKSILKRFLNAGIWNLRALLKNTVKMVVVLAAGVLMLFVGTANKFGVDETLGLMDDEELQEVVIRASTTRVSMSLASLINMGNNYLNDRSVQITAVGGPLENLRARANGILGISVIDKPDAWSVNRLNFLLTYKTDHERAGASPGLIASGLYLPFFPFNLLLIAFYTLIILRWLQKSTSYGQYSPLVLLTILYFVIPVFQSPIDHFLNFLDPAFVYFVCFIFVMTATRDNSKKTIFAESADEPRNLNK